MVNQGKLQTTTPQPAGQAAHLTSSAQHRAQSINTHLHTAHLKH